MSRDRVKILLAEDDAGVRRSLQLLIEGRGFEVRAFASGHALLADSSALAAACLVADYCIPGLDGLAILSALRARGWARPAILITAFPAPDLAPRAAAHGFASVIEKPLRHQHLVDTIVRLVG